jgi:hypothetical protein
VLCGTKPASSPEAGSTRARLLGGLCQIREGLPGFTDQFVPRAAEQLALGAGLREQESHADTRSHGSETHAQRVLVAHAPGEIPRVAQLPADKFPRLFGALTHALLGVLCETTHLIGLALREIASSPFYLIEFLTGAVRHVASTVADLVSQLPGAIGHSGAGIGAPATSIREARAGVGALAVIASVVSRAGMLAPFREEPGRANPHQRERQGVLAQEVARLALDIAHAAAQVVDLFMYRFHCAVFHLSKGIRGHVFGFMQCLRGDLFCFLHDLLRVALQAIGAQLLAERAQVIADLRARPVNLRLPLRNFSVARLAGLSWLLLALSHLRASVKL